MMHSEREESNKGIWVRAISYEKFVCEKGELDNLTCRGITEIKMDETRAPTAAALVE